MTQIYSDREGICDRISPIIDNLFRSKTLFQQKLKQAETIDLLSALILKNFTPEQLAMMPDDELTRKLRRAMAIEAVSGTLNDLTPEEMAIFDAAVERK